MTLNFRRLLLVMMLLLPLAAGGCKKKDAAVEGVTAGAKPPVVKRKAKDGEPAKGEPTKADAAKVEGGRPAPVAAAAPTAVAAPAPPAAVAMAAAATPAAGPAAAAAAPAAAAPAAAPPAAAPAAGPAADPAAAGARPTRVGPNPLGGADPQAAAPTPPDRPGVVPEPAPKVPDRLAAEVPTPAPAAEPAPAPPPALAPAAREPGEPPLDITGYLSAADIERVLGNKAKLRRSDLPGTAPSPSYNVIYFGPDKGDGFGVALQVWRDSNLAESRTRFNTMRNTYSNVAPTNKVAEQGFRAFFNGVVTLVFANARRPMVAAVSCSTKTCTADQLIELAHRASERLQ